jgi:hypothetical protein
MRAARRVKDETKTKSVSRQHPVYHLRTNAINIRGRDRMHHISSFLHVSLNYFLLSLFFFVGKALSRRRGRVSLTRLRSPPITTLQPPSIYITAIHHLPDKE